MWVAFNRRDSHPSLAAWTPPWQPATGFTLGRTKWPNVGLVIGNHDDHWRGTDELVAEFK